MAAKHRWLAANAPSDKNYDGLNRLVWEHVRDSPGMIPSDDWQSHAPTALVEMVQEPLSHLAQLASNGSKRAMVEILSLARQLATFLEEEAKKNPPRWKKLAERQNTWPVLMGQKDEHNDSVRESLRKLNVGAKASDPRQMAGRVRGTRGLTLLAIELLARLERSRGLLPQGVHDLCNKGKLPVRIPTNPFSADNAEEWAAAAWQLLCKDHGGHPEKDAKLAPYGRHREEHYAQPKPTGRPTSRTRSSNVKDGIRDYLSKSIERLAQEKKPRKVPGK